MLDCHEYLAKRGWKGKGTALRSGGIAKPINVTQKRTLSGLGKDRDEAFPFWEHVYDTSISAIRIKVYDSDTDSDDEEPHHSTDATLRRTSTGIISNRRPTTGVDASNATTSTSRLNILGNVKRSLAQRQLYSRFYRGPVITDSEFDSHPTSGTSTPSVVASNSPSLLLDTTLISSPPETLTPALVSSSSKKRKRDHKDGGVSESGERAARRAARRARQEEKLQRRAARKARRAARAGHILNGLTSPGDGPSAAPNSIPTLDAARMDSQGKEDKQEKKKKRQKRPRSQ